MFLVSAEEYRKCSLAWQIPWILFTSRTGTTHRARGQARRGRAKLHVRQPRTFAVSSGGRDFAACSRPGGAAKREKDRRRAAPAADAYRRMLAPAEASLCKCLAKLAGASLYAYRANAYKYGLSVRTRTCTHSCAQSHLRKSGRVYNPERIPIARVAFDERP